MKPTYGRCSELARTANALSYPPALYSDAPEPQEPEVGEPRRRHQTDPPPIHGRMITCLALQARNQSVKPVWVHALISVEKGEKRTDAGEPLPRATLAM